MKQYKFYSFFIWVAIVALLFGCEPQEDASPGIGTPPTASDVTFTATPTAANPNIIQLQATTPGAFIFKWKLGNGSVADGKEVTVAYPLQGDYLVELTIYTRSGSASSSQVISIAQTDFSLLDTPQLRNLTGGIENTEGKTWVIDSTNFAHFGVGPANTNFPDFYQATPLQRSADGMYNDRFTFKLENFEFIWDTGGDIFAQSASAGEVGGVTGAGDQRLAFTSPGNLTWGLNEDGQGRQILTLSDNAFIGFYVGATSYELIVLSEFEMFIKFIDSKDAGLAWYYRLIPAGYVPPTANFDFSLEGKTATFTNTSVGTVSYEWDFGDGNTSTAENPVHTYQENGTYDVTLTASNSAGASSTISKSVLVAEISVSEAALTGGSSKTWKLKTGPNTWGVGPTPGSFEFFPGGNDESVNRPCTWNDEYTFTSTGDFIFDNKGDFFAEAYYGAGQEFNCEPGSVLEGTPGNIWNSATHSFTFIPAAGANRAKIQLDGLGAFIGLAKAYNGGEFTSPPTTTDNYPVVYDIINYSNEDGVESMTIGIDVGGVWWNFVLVSI